MYNFPKISTKKTHNLTNIHSNCLRKRVRVVTLRGNTGTITINHAHTAHSIESIYVDRAS
jgi:hypothetical protein